MKAVTCSLPFILPALASILFPMSPHERAIIRDFPARLTSERLEFRAPTPNDAEFMNPAILASMPSLQPWMSWAKTPPSMDETRLYCRRALLEWHDRESLDYRLFLDDKFVGNCAVHTINWDVPFAQLGYWLHIEHQGKGLMIEAVERLMQFAFEELKLVRLEIRCNARNAASAGVAVRAGFEKEAHLRKCYRSANGTLNDALVFAKVDEIAI